MDEEIIADKGQIYNETFQDLGLESVPQIKWDQYSTMLWLRDIVKLSNNDLNILQENQIDGSSLVDLDENILIDIGFAKLRAK